MMRSKERHTLASIVRVFLHSAPKTSFRRGCFSTSHFRFLSKNSTLCSNTTRGLNLDSSKGAAVCKKSQNIKSKCLRAAKSSTVERKRGRYPLATKYGRALH